MNIENINSVTPEDNEVDLESRVHSVESIDELKDLIDEIAPVKGSTGRVYSSDELINFIDGVCSGEFTFNKITKTSGLREKVAELVAPIWIENVTEFDNLKHVINIINSGPAPFVTSSGEKYENEYLITAVDGLYNGLLKENSVTRTYGLRDKVLWFKRLRDATPANERGK